MSGLFSRLALQHVSNHSLGIKPVQSPVFPVNPNENRNYDVEQQQESTQHQFEPSDYTSAVIDNNSDTPLSEAHVTNKPKATEQKNDLQSARLLTPASKPVIKPTAKVINTKEQSLSEPVFSEPELKPLFQTQFFSNDSSHQAISKKDKESSLAKVAEAETSTERQVISESTIIKQQILPSSSTNRSIPASQKPVLTKQDDNQTTINISIGRIEIKATQPDKTKKKTVATSNKNRSSALEEYHQKRLRGER